MMVKPRLGGNRSTVGILYLLCTIASQIPTAIAVVESSSSTAPAASQLESHSEQLLSLEEKHTKQHKSTGSQGAKQSQKKQITLVPSSDVELEEPGTEEHDVVNGVKKTNPVRTAEIDADGTVKVGESSASNAFNATTPSHVITTTSPKALVETKAKASANCNVNIDLNVKRAALYCF